MWVVLQNILSFNAFWFMEKINIKFYYRYTYEFNIYLKTMKILMNCGFCFIELCCLLICMSHICFPSADLCIL